MSPFACFVECQLSADGFSLMKIEWGDFPEPTCLSGIVCAATYVCVYGIYAPEAQGPLTYLGGPGVCKQR